MSDKLQEIKESLKTVTNLPWSKYENCIFGTAQTAIDPIIAELGENDRDIANAKFIANAPEYVSWLIEQLEQAQKNLTNCLAANNELDQRCINMKNALDAIHSKNNGEYHAWVRDEDNNLETLSCTVMIDADDLRHLINTQLEQAQASNQKLVEGLEWYAEEDTWLEPDGAGILPIDYDEGQRARQTLSEVKGNV